MKCFDHIPTPVVASGEDMKDSVRLSCTEDRDSRYFGNELSGRTCATDPRLHYKFIKCVILETWTIDQLHVVGIYPVLKAHNFPEFLGYVI